MPDTNDSAHAPLQGRVFARQRAFLALSESHQQRILALADTLFVDGELKNVREIESTRLVAVIDAAARSAAAAADADPSSDVVQDDTSVLIDHLVLSGRVALANEADTSSTQLSGFAGTGVVFVPIVTPTIDPAAAGATAATAVSVWSLRDGAIQAGELQRAGKFSKLFGGKRSYVVVHEATQTLTWFKHDAATQHKGQFALSGAAVQFDDALHHGIKVSKEKTVVYFGATTKASAEAWLNAIINAGATYREAFNVDVESVQSIYELKDFDMSGNAVDMANYKGKVLLIVNVSSKCKLTPTNYPELAELDRKYRDQGLAILAFPCNQFANQEPGTHAEIVEFVKQYKCEFPFFEKHDVNGADARPVFTYLKAKLPGSFGNFVKWNFTKFLVDRNGQPYKRFAPKDLPMSFEDEIVKLLNTPAATEGATTTSGDGMSAADVTPTVAADNMSSSPAPVTNDDETKPPAGGDQQPADTAAATETVT